MAEREAIPRRGANIHKPGHVTSTTRNKMKSLRILQNDTIVCQKFNWFDKVNGNSYNALRIKVVRKGKYKYIIERSFTYGYEGVYDAAQELMIRLCHEPESPFDFFQRLKSEKNVCIVICSDADRKKTEILRSFSRNRIADTSGRQFDFEAYGSGPAKITPVIS